MIKLKLNLKCFEIKLNTLNSKQLINIIKKVININSKHIKIGESL